MRLTDYEIEMVCRRAMGEYAIIGACRRILTSHKKSDRDPKDKLYYEFLEVALAKTIKWARYEKLQKQILERHPPRTPPPLDQPRTKQKPEKVKGVRRCKICGTPGHNARTCPEKEGKKTLEYDDGFERLAPGYDPFG